jgi:hypothetical protein
MAASIAGGCITPSGNPQACIPQFHDHALPVVPTLLRLLQGSAARTAETPLATIPLEAQVLFIGVVFLGTLVVSRFSIKIGIPAIYGELALGLMINIHVVDVDHSEVETLHVSALAPPIRARR